MVIPDFIRMRKPLPTTVTPEDHINAWLKQDERISSAPSGPHFEHFEAGITDEYIVKFDALSRSLSHQCGFSSAPWREIVDVEILKKAGVCDTEKMRTITLMHAELNMNNKKLGRDVMQRATEAGSVAPEQCGSRPRHMSVTAA